MSYRPKPELWLGAFAGFYRPGVEEVRGLDAVSKFLYAARSIILVISAQAAIIAGLIAAADRRFEWSSFALVLAGFVVAHMVSNLSNDYFGYRRDTTRRIPRACAIPCIRSQAACSARARSRPASRSWRPSARPSPFTSSSSAAGLRPRLPAGIALLLLYDAAPIPLKSIGLGEVAVFLVWGPLMVGDGYAVIADELSSGALTASIPYGLGVMSILTGKHLDQMAFDAGKGNRPCRCCSRNVPAEP